MKHITRIGLAAVALLLGGCATGGKSFDSPQTAATALIEAVSPLDDAKIRTVLGSEGVPLIRSGDPIDDQASIDRFVENYRTKHELVEVDANRVVLEVGPDNWPMPIPLVRSGKGWRFDTDAGAEEIVSRRIGRNELNTMQACLAIVDAQREYAAGGFGGAPGVFADRFISSPGQRNGLAWPTTENEPASPLGPFLAEASPERAAEVQSGTATSLKGPRPFHGYIYRMLRSQGHFAPGGVMEYASDGRLTKGFAVIAAPAEYGNSGVMTFMVNQHGVIYERDLGTNTASKAAAITAFDPTPEWAIVPQDWE